MRGDIIMSNNTKKDPQVDIDQLFITRNGKTIADERLSDKLYHIKKERPERSSESDSGYEWSEMGLAELFSVVYKNEVKYCEGYKSWFVYNGHIWDKDPSGHATAGKLQEFTRLLNIYAWDIAEEEIRNAYTKFTKKLEDRRVRDRVQKDAITELSVDPTIFDANPYLINCKNGTYDLKTHKFTEHRWEDFLTMTTKFGYGRFKYKSERWLKFIDEITEGDKHKADFLQRALGYSLLGESNEECMFILHGKTTRNGKSTLLNTICSMLGDYSTVANVQLICKGSSQKSQSATPEIMALKGRRFVTMAENEDDSRLDESKIKQFTGGEEITGRALYQAPITFLPQFSLWLSCNDLPEVTDKSLFTSERLKVVEFNRHFSQAEQDKHLKSELLTEENMRGIFAWLIEGYKKYKKHGLVVPDDMQKVIKRYEEDCDVVLQFLNCRCERVDDGKLTKVKEIHTAYKSWAKGEGLQVMSSRKFRAEIDRHPEWYDRKSTKDGYVAYEGLKLKEIM